MNELLTSWILTYLLHSTVLVAALWAVDRRAWLRDPALRERLWRAALVVPVMSAALQVAMPEVAVSRHALVVAETGRGAEAPLLQQMEQAARPQGTENVAATVSGGHDAEAPLLQESAVVTESKGRGAVAPLLRVSWFEMLSGAWFALAAWLLARTAASVIAGRRSLRGRRVVVDGAARSMLDALSAAAGVRARLSVADDAPGPMTLPRGEICVPPQALDLPADELRGMLAHELAHVVRRDAEQRLLITVACALLALQPLNFVVRRRLVEVAELNADDYARGLLGDGRPLARCLVRVATWLEPARAPAFAAAMAESDQGLLARVRRLASAAPQVRGWRGRGALVLLLLLATFAVPGIVMTAVDSDGSRTPSVHIRASGDQFSVSASGRELSLKLKADGTVRFAADESGIEYLEPGKTLTIRARDKRGDSLWHELTVTAASDGALGYAYRVDKRERPFDAAARAWLTDLLPEIFRATGMQAEERVARIHARGGVDAVLEEIGLISSDYVAKLYFAALGGTDGVTVEQRARAYRLAGASIGSDYELRGALSALPLGADSTQVDAIALLVAAREIGSDYELAELLIDVTDRLPRDERVAAAFAAAAETVGSDYELSRALIAASRSDWARGAALGSLVRVSAHIGSDHDHQNFLRRVFASGQLDPAVARLALEVAARDIRSDHELLQVLLEAAPLAKADAELRAVYEDAAKTLGNHEFARAMRAL